MPRGCSIRRAQEQAIGREFARIATKSKEMMPAEREQLTTAHGAAVEDNQNSLIAGPRGPFLMQDYQLLEKMATFNRERVPERVVYAKGSGAYGTFTIGNDVTRYTKARIFVMANRFSTSIKGAPPCRKITSVAG